MDCIYIVDDWQQAFHLHYIKIISLQHLFFFFCLRAAYLTDIIHALFIVINTGITSIIIHTDSKHPDIKGIKEGAF